MSRKRAHFGSEEKARSFSREVNGDFNQNKGNSDKPYTVSFNMGVGVGVRDEGSDFDSDLNGSGTCWHTSEDL